MAAEICTNFVQPLNLECLFVNMFAGSWILFGLLAILAIIFMAGKFRMTGAGVLVSVVAFAIIFFHEIPAIASVILFFCFIGIAWEMWKTIGNK